MQHYNNFNLKAYNAYRIESICSKALFPENEEDLVQIFKNELYGKIMLLGNGNNIILSKSYYNEVFVILNGCFNDVKVIGNKIVAYAGSTMLQLSDLALKNSLSGFEIFNDIPSSVGGAVVMNAGASGEEIKDLLIKVRYLDLWDMKIKEIKNQEIGFEYRDSFFQKNVNMIILKVWFQLKNGNKKVIKTKMEETKIKRWAKQPRDYPNCGSVFKRPPNRFVGAMLDELGLKGFQIGGAKVSEKHSGFIVNTGTATGEDILQLIKVIKEKVKSKFGIDLEVEQRII